MELKQHPWKALWLNKIVRYPTIISTVQNCLQTLNTYGKRSINIGLMGIFYLECKIKQNKSKNTLFNVGMYKQITFVSI